MFIGYSNSHKGYKALLPSGKVIVTKDILFDKSIFPYKSLSHASIFYSSLTPSFSSLPPPPIFSPPISPSSPSISPIPPASSSPVPPAHSPQIYSSPRPSSAPITFSPDVFDASPGTSPPILSSSPTDTSSFDILVVAPTSPAPPLPGQHHMITRAKKGIFKPKLLTSTTDQSEDELCFLIPHSAKIALAITVWKCAMNEEFLALLRNKTWTLCFLPPAKNLI